MANFCKNCGRVKGPSTDRNGDPVEDTHIKIGKTYYCAMEFTVVNDDGEREESPLVPRTKRNQAAWVHASRLAEAA